MSVPRTLHMIWVGPRLVPETWIAEWRRMHPTWDHRLWREADLADFPMLNRAAFDYYQSKENWVGMSDIARMAILRELGGVYVDVDSKPLHTFDGAPFMDAQFFAAYEPVASLPGRVAAGTVGAEARHPIFDTLARLISEMPSIDEVWDTTGGTGLTAAILAHRQCCKPLVLPARTFYATDAQGRPVPGREIAYSQHFWATTNHIYPAKAVIVVPRRADGGRRDALWQFTRRHWEALGWPIVEGHHDEGPFNAAAARNAAARIAGEWEVAVFVDADTVMLDHEPVRKAVRIADASGQMVRPYNRYWMTDEGGADAFMATGRRPSVGIRPLRSTDAHGGVNVVPRRLWGEVGGYDERFRGWGSEDAAFELACRMLGASTSSPARFSTLASAVRRSFDGRSRLPAQCRAAPPIRGHPPAVRHAGAAQSATVGRPLPLRSGPSSSRTAAASASSGRSRAWRRWSVRSSTPSSATTRGITSTSPGSAIDSRNGACSPIRMSAMAPP